MTELEIYNLRHIIMSNIEDKLIERYGEDSDLDLYEEILIIYEYVMRHLKATTYGDEDCSEILQLTNDLIEYGIAYIHGEV